MKNTASKIRTCVAILLLSLAAGCASWTTIGERPLLSEAFTGTTFPTQQTQPAFLKDCRVTVNGTEVNPSQDFVNRFLNNVTRTGLFTPARTGAPDQGLQRYVVMTLSVDENKDTHQGEAIGKGVLIGLTLYLLAPVLPLRYDFESQMTLSVALVDGRSKQYTARGSGTAHFHLFANAYLAGQDVEGKVTSSNINSIMNQLMKDSALYEP